MHHHSARDESDVPPFGIRDVLDELQALGDVALLPKGRWLPAPLRVVPLRSIRAWALVGGRPSHLLPSTAGAAARTVGAARLLQTDPRELGLLLPEQPEEDWCRIPPEPIDLWAARVINEARLVADSGEASVEVYVPTAGPGSPIPPGCFQTRRWLARLTDVPDGRYLVRSRSRFGQTRHAVAQLAGGRLVATGPLELGTGDVRRLLYGLDAIADNPIRVEETRHGQARAFVLRDELPRAELRLLTALGDLVVPLDGRYYPREWRVPDQFAPQVVAALRRLQVRIGDREGLPAPGPIGDA
jgi:hypothetical protein